MKMGAKVCVAVMYGVVSSGIFAAASNLTPTAADRAEFERLIKQVDQAKSRGYTQTEAHLSVPSVQKAVGDELNLDRNKHIISQALEKEREFNDGYYVFYTAIPHMRLFQDVTRKVYKRAVGNIGALQNKSFQFIRYAYNDKDYNKYNNVTDFLVDELSTNGIIDDNQTELKTILVSTNLSLFGNAAFAGESTWRFLNSPQPWGVAPQSWLEKSLKSFKYPPEFAKKFIELAPLIKHDQGDLFQIFIPKSLVDDVGYLSWRQGIPFDPAIIQQWFGRDPLELGKFGDVKKAIVHDEINERIYVLRRKWKMGDPQVRDIVNVMIEGAKEGKYWLSRGLDAYKNSPQDVFEINYQQARLLITNSMLLNPVSGIKIYRYSTLSADKLAEYKRQLRRIMTEMDAYKKRISPK